MTPDQYISRMMTQVETAVAAAVEKTTEQTARIIRHELPARRVKTRRAVQYRVQKRNNQIAGTIRLRFQREYTGNVEQTQTARLFRRAWQRVEPTVVDNLTTHLNNEMKGI